jgi:hypothetical protein
LSESVWSYEISNGFIHHERYISGWGNEELQYYQEGKGANFTNDNLFIEDGFLKIQPIFHKDENIEAIALPQQGLTLNQKFLFLIPLE